MFTKFFFKQFILFLGLGCILIFVSAYAKQFDNSGLLYGYGFDTEEQQEAIKRLLKAASIIPENKSFHEVFESVDSQDGIANSVLLFVQSTQEKFSTRTGYKERWEITEQEWIKRRRDQLYNDLEILGFVDRIAPKRNKFDAIGVLGGSYFRMEDRIKYAEYLVKNGLDIDSIILLAGERYVTKDVDGSEEQLIKIASEYSIKDWHKLTETHLIKYLFDRSSLKGIVQNHYVIDTPKNNLPRPTTETTMYELLKLLDHENHIKSILFVSNQPYVKYQGAIIDNVLLSTNKKIEFEVVGEGTKANYAVYSIMEGLGSYIWAKSPEIIRNLSVDINKSTKDKLKELYKRSPLIYKNISGF